MIGAQRTQRRHLRYALYRNLAEPVSVCSCLVSVKKLDWHSGPGVPLIVDCSAPCIADKLQALLKCGICADLCNVTCCRQRLWLPNQHTWREDVLKEVDAPHLAFEGAQWQLQPNLVGR